MSRLFVISGHGAGDCGAVGNGYQEAERVRALATKIKEYGGDNVILSDFALNSYQSNIIGKGLVPKDCIILELHLDSSTSASAKGGHVIIHGNFKADKYDNALATMISTMFPGRSSTIVGRTDLANVKRAAAKGYNYRLMECCFISNADDIAKFNANIDNLAQKILGCFDIAVKEDIVVKETPTVAKHPVDDKISVTYQVWDDVKNAWLPNVVDTTDYAGIFGHDVCGVFANLTKGNIIYKVHTKGGRWLPEVKNREDYAGILNKPIDALMMKTDTGKTIRYAVHLRRSNRWLPSVTGYNENDYNNGFAGIFGQEIDGVKIYIE
jgi:hypothetical protein